MTAAELRRRAKHSPFPLVLFPEQLGLAEKAGLVRGQDFVLPMCLACVEGADRCKCPKR